MKKFGTFLMVLGVMCIMGAVGLLLYNRMEDNHAGEESASALDQLKQYIAETAGDPTIVTPEEKDTVKPDVNVNDLYDMPTFYNGIYDFIGYIQIPKLELELPILDHWDYERLNVSPCRYYGAIATGDLVLAGHNYPKHFGNLKLLEIDDKVLFYDPKGKVYIYEVKDIQIVPPNNVLEVLESKHDLVLFTCTLNSKSRVTVFCDLVPAERLQY